MRIDVPADWLEKSEVNPPGGIAYSEYQALGATSIYAWAGETGVRTGKRNPGIRGYHSRITMQTGWPLRSLSCAVSMDDSGTSPPSVIGGIEAPNWLVCSGESSAIERVLRIDYLPVHPIVRGTLLNTALWAVCVFAALWGPRSVRRYFRCRRGACMACGYDRRGLAADAKCPECGTVPAPASK